ncbi:hypothetical protein ACIQPR_21780 [Streptomyces sp. NPDC091280]|uniref:hypothetical protein n=1 Tax=Streptomyces sp. NPDC091280 TaxID=3365984 RepID=UPI003809C381
MERTTNPYLPDTRRGALIVFDADQLELVGFPDGAVFRMLHAAARLNGHTLAVPQAVAIEYLAHPPVDAQPSTERPPEEAAQRRLDALQAYFTVLPTPEGAAEEALKRVADRRVPGHAQSDTGEDDGKAEERAVQDTVVWLTLLDAFEAHNRMLWFLSDNHNFAQRSAFHPDLRAEAEQRLGTDRSLLLGLMRDGVPTLLKRWGTRVRMNTRDLDLLVRSDAVAQQVRNTVTRPARPFATDFSVPSTTLLAFDGRLGRPHAQQVTDRLWLTSRIRWRCYGEESAPTEPAYIVTRLLLEVGVEPLLVRGVTVLDAGAVEPSLDGG